MKKKHIQKKHLAPSLTQKLKNLEKNLDITRHELISAIHIQPDTFTRYTNGTRIPSLAVLANLAHNYNISLDWLLLDRGPMFHQAEPPSFDRYTDLYES